MNPRDQSQSDQRVLSLPFIELVLSTQIGRTCETMSNITKAVTDIVMANDTDDGRLWDLEILSKNMDAFFLIVNGFLIFFMQCGFAFLEAGSLVLSTQIGRTCETMSNITKAVTDIVMANDTDDGRLWDLEILSKNMDAFFLIVNGFLIFFMQCGFAFLEAGSVRTKNIVNILIKNMLDALIGGVAYWVLGWAVSYGPHGNGFIGGSNFLSIAMRYEDYPMWFFQFVFAATAATIVSGSIAERCQFFAYFVYSILITGWVYPPVSHWAWDANTPGWLNQLGYQDFAGSGVVHLLGGTCALVGCVLIKPRMGRFDSKGKVIDMPGHSVPLAALGGFILLFGFLAFNGGSQARISQEGDSESVARAVVNTILGGCGAGLTVLILNKFYFGIHWSYLMTLNGALAGMVGLCAGCNVYQPWSAIVIGMICGVAFLLVHVAMLKMRFDDPLDAVAVHGAGGLCGVILMPFFAYETGIFWAGDTEEAWKALGINLIGAVAIMAWSATWSFLIFYPLKYFKMLRIDRETEFRGNDLVKHGESAYPADAWVELQYNASSDVAIGSGPSHMSGTSGDRKISKSSYNNANEMVPTQSALMSGLGNTFGSMVMSEKKPEPNGLPKGVDNVSFTH
eukprot:maker-scaffold557_size137338-snap-gene-0.13 protein:Tk03363 transcript:maker-scaffold557_size137338-snap-gene-0.13-mRNA-1 annotation:"predicted protein"